MIYITNIISFIWEKINTLLYKTDRSSPFSIPLYSRNVQKTTYTALSHKMKQSRPAYWPAPFSLVVLVKEFLKFIVHIVINPLGNMIELFHLLRNNSPEHDLKHLLSHQL